MLNVAIITLLSIEGLISSTFTNNNGIVTTTATLLEDDEGKIIGGEEIDIDRVPFLVSLQFSPFGDFYSHRCGASLISPLFVLTAAHCMVYVTQPNQLQIRTGSSNHNNGGQVKIVQNYTIHPLFNATTYNYDMAILKLVSRVWVAQPENLIERIIGLFTSWLLPKSPKVIELSNVYDVPNRTLYYTAGWGTTQFGGPASSALFGLIVPSVSRSVCKQMYSNETITNNMICAGYIEGGKDTCQGDSGGPLVHQDKLIGVVSWGDGCAKAKKPGVYSSVAAMRSFINEHVDFDA